MKKNKLPNFLTAASIVALGLTFLSSTSRAGVLFSDDFTGQTGATLNSYGYYFQNYSNAGTAWTTATDNTTPLSGTVLSNPAPGTSANSFAFKQFSSSSLTNVGDFITIQLDMHTPAAGAGAFSLALLGSSNSISANNFGGTDPVGDAAGYGFYQTLSGSATSPSYWKISNDDPLPYATSLSTVSQSTSINDDLGHTLSFTLTKTVTGIRVDSQFDSTVFDSFTDTSSIYSSFNTLRLTGSDGQVFNFDNVSVTTGVPEPASSMMLGAAGIVLVLMRLRRRIRAAR